MQPAVGSLDHIVLTVADIAATCDFYQRIMGMVVEPFTPADGSLRYALKFGVQKINLHKAGAEFEPKADKPTKGSADLCFLSETPLDAWLEHLDANGVPVEDGPVRRSGANGPILSVYIRDPDRNLIEISNKVE
ncbi:VOC family protein [Thalassococcus lentus]|uniref:VOC family protein n=1 Tax=Thalassococcus lentus TaxID=1210524 RepID=A0ABT4XPP3_9RHOB|nr:VOC family protein [Thalassococcus lentus]MDA7423875.1 VOC family protein [Thalassococcus lentus]